MRRLLGIVILGLAAGLVLGVQARGAQAHWSPVQYFLSGDVFSAASAFGKHPSEIADVAINRRGDAIVSEVFTTGAVAVRERVGPRGRWSAPRILDRSPPLSLAPIVRINGRGAALVIWGTKGRLRAARREPGGPWLPAGALPPATRLSVALADDGTASVVREIADPPGCGVSGGCRLTAEVLRQRRRGDAWTVGGRSPLAILSMNRRGDVLVGLPSSPSAPIEVARLLVGSTGFEAPQAVSSQGATLLSLAIGDGGDAAVAWTPVLPPAGHALWIAVRPAGSATWFPAEQVTGMPYQPFLLAIDAEGTVAFAWNDRWTIGVGLRPALALSWVGWLDVKTVPPNETLSMRDLWLDRGTVYVHWDNHHGPGDNSTGIKRRDPVTGAWTDANYLVFGTGGGGYGPAAFATAPGGRMIAVGVGMTVQNYDTNVTRPPPVARYAVARGLRRRAALTFALSRAARVHVRVDSVPSGAVVRRIADRLVRAGRHTIDLGRFRTGSYLLFLATCDRMTGCRLPSSPVKFIVR